VRRTVEKDRQSRLVQSEAGQAALEFALTIGITLLLIFGLIDFSRAIYASSIIQWAAQQGARVGITDATQAEVEAAVYGRMVGLDTEQALITVSRPNASLVQVEVTYQFQFIVPMVARITGDSIEMQASASMVAY
jgi:Flp pilus assembly protein TadG